MKLIDLSQSHYKFLITGGTGFIGTKLCQELLKNEQKITILTRKIPTKPNQKIEYITNLDEKEFNYDIIINLCGEPISQRWSNSTKEKIYQSRIKTTRNLVDKINNSSNPPKLLISGSAIGYYGTSLTTIFHEKLQPTKQNLFSQQVCFDWEKEANLVKEKTNLAIIRTGVVLGKNGGMIKKLLPPFKFGIGGKISSGKQMISWIHIDDAIRAIGHIINKNITGIINLTSPNFVSNNEFSKALAKSVNRPCLLTVPAFTMKIIYGKMADEIILQGQKVYPQTLLESGFEYKYEEISEALRAI